MKNNYSRSGKRALPGLLLLLCVVVLLLNSCNETATVNQNARSSKPLLRYVVPLVDRDIYLDEVIKQCRSMGIEEVLQFTMLSNGEYGGDAFYDGEEFEKRMEHLRYCADRIRKEGLILSINAFHTLGHIRVPEEVVQHFGFERQLTREGKPNLHPVLDPRSQKLREHLATIYSVYASLKPHRIFVDDDYMVPLAASFHKGRVNEFARIVGCDSTREAVAALVYSDNPETAAKMQNIMGELLNRDLEDLAKIIEQAVHKVSPETKIGVMFPFSIKNDVARIAKALAGEHVPFVRPQMPIYREDIPVASYPQVFWSIPNWQSKLGDGFELFPEIENFPYTNFSKSPEATYAQIASVFGRGIGSPAYNLENFRNPRVINYISERKAQVKRLTDLLAAKSRPTGLGIWNMSACNLELLGLPLKAVSEPADGDIFLGSGLSGLTDSQLEGLVRKGAIFDMDAMRVMKQRGFLPKMGVDELTQSDRNNIINIDFNQEGRPDDLNWNIYYWLRNLPDPAWPMEFKAQGETRLYSCINHANEITVPYAVKWSGPDGQHFGFINFSYNSWPVYAWLHTWMPGIMSELAAWVKTEAVNVMIRDSPRVAVEMCETEDGKVLLTLINYSTGTYGDVTLSLSDKLGKMKWSEITGQGEERGCSVRNTGPDYEIKSGSAIPSLGVKFFVGQ
ncbi:MAG: hypothetical protein O2887_10555 [Bacteroidetes bacterium]|nr:hypothetical protein [Bacteroidota bacterium]